MFFEFLLFRIKHLNLGVYAEFYHWFFFSKIHALYTKFKQYRRTENIRIK